MAEPSSLSSPCFTSQGGEAPEGFTGPEMAAAQQLMQLSGDEEDHDCKSKNKESPDEELDQNQSEITSAKIEEIFGREDEEDEEEEGEEGEKEEEKQLRPKKRRIRSLVHIYRTTKPVNVKKVRC